MEIDKVRSNMCQNQFKCKQSLNRKVKGSEVVNLIKNSIVFDGYQLGSLVSNKIKLEKW